ncbi:MAG: carbohydrate-binding family 9-like protein [Sedimentisphaerales bacterium]|nr:carbohydrate-binding family 9-like protein [Sedimentisphaerales bacterium]
MHYDIEKTGGDFHYPDDWDRGRWSRTPALKLTHYMGDRPEHFPVTQAKLLYDDEHIHVFFRVEDRYVKAVARAHQDSVCRDSCVEFFFTPGIDIAQGYFNVEVNCGGMVLFYHQKGRNIDRRMISVDDIARMRVEHFLPEYIDAEIEAPTTWTIKYALPLAVLEAYAPVSRPRQGVTWRANFYKCADQTSHPHWLTWSPVDKPTPDFHQPQFFGVLEFT